MPRHLIARAPPTSGSPSARTSTGVDVVVRIARLPEVPVGQAWRRRRQGLGHEAELHERLHACARCRCRRCDRGSSSRRPDCPGVLGIDVGRSPLQRGMPSPDVSRLCTRMNTGTGLSVLQRGQQLLAVGRVGVVRFVVAEPGPEGMHRPDPCGRVDGDRNRIVQGCLPGPGRWPSGRDTRLPACDASITSRP